MVFPTLGPAAAAAVSHRRRGHAETTTIVGGPAMHRPTQPQPLVHPQPPTSITTIPTKRRFLW